MKSRNLYAVALLSAVMTASVLTGCDKAQNTGTQQTAVNTPTPSVDPVQAQKVELLNDMSGVWNPDDNSGLWTLYYADNKFQAVVNDDFLPVTVGDVDPGNETVNLKVSQSGSGQKIITIRRIWDTAHTAYHLHVTMWDGSQATLSFVRKVSSDDLNRIGQLAAAAQPRTTQTPVASAVAIVQSEIAAPAQTPDASPAGQAADAAAAVAASTAAAGAIYETSFDCGGANSIPQYLICHDPDLAASDRNLANVVKQARAVVQDQDAFADRIRKQWNYRERNCKDKSCLTTWYQYENDVLTKIVQTGQVDAN